MQPVLIQLSSFGAHVSPKWFSEKSSRYYIRGLEEGNLGRRPHRHGPDPNGNYQCQLVKFFVTLADMLVFRGILSKSAKHTVGGGGWVANAIGWLGGVWVVNEEKGIYG